MAVISHELRAPLNGIMGYSDLLTAGVPGELNDEQRQHVDRIRLGADHLLRIIDDILIFLRSETGPMEIRAEPFRVAYLVEEVGLMLRPEADRKGIVLETTGDERVVISDRERLLRIIGNLLANAVEFTDDGWVRVDARVRDARLRVLIEDTGPGIAEADRDRVFDPFRQVDQSSTRRVGGTGLGLSIARRLARQLGGDVTLEPRPGQGSRFTMDLPVQPRD